MQNTSEKPCAVTGTAPTAVPDHYRIAVALAGLVGTLQAERYTLRADNARLKFAVEQLLEENESISASFETVLAVAEKGNVNA